MPWDRPKATPKPAKMKSSKGRRNSAQRNKGKWGAAKKRAGSGGMKRGSTARSPKHY